MIFEIWEKHWKAFLVIPAILLILSLGYFIFNIYNYDTPVRRSVELAGGKEILAEVSKVDEGLRGLLEGMGLEYRVIGEATISITIPYRMNETEVLEEIGNYADIRSYSVRTVGPVLGEKFWSQTIMAIIASLAIISAMVFILYRSFVPSFAVVSSIIIDLMVTTAIVSILGFDFSLPMLGALLTIISYSIDTDILLTTKLIRKDKEFNQSLKEALRTGFVITLAAFLSASAVFFLTSNQVLKDISIVLMVGLVVDFMTTWLQNAGIIRWWVHETAK